jgi:hypothetical protein
MTVKQLCLEIAPAPTVGPSVVLEETTTHEVVALLSEAILAVFAQEGGGHADDEPCPKS